MCFWLTPTSLCWVKYVNLIVPSPEDVFHLQTQTDKIKEANYSLFMPTKQIIKYETHFKKNDSDADCAAFIDNNKPYP